MIATAAQASNEYSYSPKGPFIMKAGPGQTRTQAITIQNKRNRTIAVMLQMHKGDSSFSIDFTNRYINIGPDSIGTLHISCTATAGDTTHAWLRLYDSISVPDTVFFTGLDSTSSIDTTDPWTGPDWTIEGGFRDLGSYYGMPDSAFIEVVNHIDESITISATLGNGAYGIVGIGSQTKTIAAKQSTRFGYKYLSADHDSAMAVVTFSGDSLSKQITLYGRKILPHPDSLDHLSGFNFGAADPGDTSCETTWIRNINSTSAIITSISDASPSKYFRVAKPTLPITLAPGDSLEITACIIFPQTADSAVWGDFSITYHSDGQNSRTDHISLNGQTTLCFAAQNYLDFGSVVRGSTSVRSFTVTNYRNYDLEITSMSSEVNSNKFALFTSLPVTIPANSSINMDVQLTADGYIYPYDRYTLHTNSMCGSSTVFVTAHIDDSLLVDSIGTPLFGNSERTLRFNGDSAHLERTFYFYNDQSDSIIIVSVSLKNGEQFSISAITPHAPELKLDSGEVMGVTLAFIGDPGNYQDTLIIVTEDGIISLSFPIEATMTGQSSVDRSNDHAAALHITPNPALGPVSISVANSSQYSVEVIDLLGNAMEHFSGASVWNASNVAHGTYFIRASGLTDTGKPFVITSRVIVR